MKNRNRFPGAVTPGVRLIAFLWDYVVIAGYLLFLCGLSVPARPLLAPLFTSGPLSAQFAGFLFITLPVYLYFSISEGSGAHATWGKRKMGIQVARASGRPIGLGTALLRSALKFAPWELAHFSVWHMLLPSGIPDVWITALLAAVYGLVIVYVFSALWSKRKQAVYDQVAGTVVQYRKQGDRE